MAVQEIHYRIMQNSETNSKILQTTSDLLDACMVKVVRIAVNLYCSSFLLHRWFESQHRRMLDPRCRCTEDRTGRVASCVDRHRPLFPRLELRNPLGS